MRNRRPYNELIHIDNELIHIDMRVIGTIVAALCLPGLDCAAVKKTLHHVISESEGRVCGQSVVHKSNARAYMSSSFQIVMLTDNTVIVYIIRYATYYDFY
jgi:hypothetical protein